MRNERLAKRAEAGPAYNEEEAARASALVKSLAEIEQVLRQKDYNGAQARLQELLKQYPKDPRVFFALAQTSSVAATDATDEDVQAQRLKTALGHYKSVIETASPDRDQALISRAHEAMGRIHAFFDNKTEAANEFEAAIKIGDVTGGAYRAAIEGKKKLEQP